MKLLKPRYYLFYHPERRNPYLFLRYKGKRKCNYRKKKKKKFFKNTQKLFTAVKTSSMPLDPSS